MDKTDQNRLAVLIGVLAEAYRQTITDATIEAYRIGLRDLTIAAVEAAVDRALRESRFMPTVAELREFAGQLRPEQRAALAWSVLKREVADGGYSTVVFDDPVLTATVRSFGGWEPVCALFDEEARDWLEGVFRKRFTDTYTALAARAICASLAAPLAGYIERTNRNGGHLSRVPKPKRIACGLPPHPIAAAAAAISRDARQQSLLEGIGAAPQEGQP